MAFSELIKNYEGIRAYIREFYIYGFKSRSEYDIKSTRSYDNEKRRLESWLDGYINFISTDTGKSVYISINTRSTNENPLYRTFKTKSFTDKDITLHFLIFDILYDSNIKLSINEIINEIDKLLESKLIFDTSTLRKKLDEYIKEGLIKKEKSGKEYLYYRSEDINLSDLYDLISFFSEISPVGVIGSFIKDKLTKNDSPFIFKHHYITQAIDSDILAIIFDAISKESSLNIDYFSKRANEIRHLEIIPLKVLISAQNGKQNLIAYFPLKNRLATYRLDYISNARVGSYYPNIYSLKEELKKSEKYMWGVNVKRDTKEVEYVEFGIHFKQDEEYILNRLIRERRNGKVDKIDDNNYRYSAYIFDTTEMLPWIRTFISRITYLKFSNLIALERFKEDLNKMYEMYMIGDDNNDF